MANLVYAKDMNVDDMAAIAFLLAHHSNILAITVTWWRWGFRSFPIQSLEYVIPCYPKWWPFWGEGGVQPGFSYHIFRQSQYGDPGDGWKDEFPLWGEEHPWTSPGVSDMVSRSIPIKGIRLASWNDREKRIQRFRSDRDDNVRMKLWLMDICQ